jgi:hypothetical protein
MFRFTVPGLPGSTSCIPTGEQISCYICLSFCPLGPIIPSTCSNFLSLKPGIRGSLQCPAEPPPGRSRCPRGRATNGTQKASIPEGCCSPVQWAGVQFPGGICILTLSIFVGRAPKTDSLCLAGTPGATSRRSRV